MSNNSNNFYFHTEKRSTNFTISQYNFQLLTARGGIFFYYRPHASGWVGGWSSNAISGKSLKTQKFKKLSPFFAFKLCKIRSKPVEWRQISSQLKTHVNLSSFCEMCAFTIDNLTGFVIFIDILMVSQVKNLKKWVSFFAAKRRKFKNPWWVGGSSPEKR